jgi:hypothetical protein
MTSIEVHTSGPIFDGASAEHTMRDLADAIGEGVAHKGIGVVRVELGKVLKHPTGHYSSNIQRSSYGSRHEIHDGRMIYGPWLAGVGSRNAPVTRFKGYAHWRRATQALKRTVPAVARGVMPRFLARLQ